MLCSRFMHRDSENPGRVYRIIEAGFNGLLAFYKYTLDILLRHRAITLGVFFATMALTGVMVYQIPKGFFPIQDTGVIQGFAEPAQEAPPDQMMRILREFGAVLLKDPDGAGFGACTGSTGGATTGSTSGSHPDSGSTTTSSGVGAVPAVNQAAVSNGSAQAAGLAPTGSGVAFPVAALLLGLLILLSGVSFLARPLPMRR